MKTVLSILLIFCSTAFRTNAQEPKDSLKWITLQEVQVVANRATEKTPLTYSNLDKEVIEKQLSVQDIPFLLTLTPSVIATSDAGTGIGYTGFRIRGTDANRINITSNGIPMNDAESQTVFWVNMPDFASSLQDLQVQRGVGTSTNGAAAFGASIHMKTEYISAIPYGELNASYGSFNTAKASIKLGTGQIANHWAFDARLSQITSDGYIDRASADLKSYFFQAGYATNNTILKFIIFGGKEKTYHAWDGVPADKLENDRTFNPSGHMKEDGSGNALPPFYDNQTDNYDQKHAQVFFTRLINSDLQLNAALHYTQGGGFYEEYKIDRKLLEYGLTPFEYKDELMKETDLVRQKYLDNKFGGGIFSFSYKKNPWDAKLGGGLNYYDGNHFGKIKWLQNYAGDNDLYPNREYYRSTSGKWDANLFLKANYQLAEQWIAYADLQYRYIRYKINGENDKWDPSTETMQWMNLDNSFHFFNPKTGIFFRPNQKNDLYISFATGHREPNRNNYTEVKLTENPKAETLYDYELGYKFKNKDFSAGVNLYYMQYKDQLILTGQTNDIGEMLTSNVPDSYRSGIELIAGAHITPWLQWTGNTTWSRNRIKNYTEYVATYDENWHFLGQKASYLGSTPIAFSPEIMANSLLSFSYKQFQTGLQSTYVGPQYLDNSGSDERKLNAYFVNHLRLTYLFYLKGIKSLKINLLINNILNEQYESNGYVWDSYYLGSERKNELRYFPQAGTNVLANVVIKF